MIWRIEFSTRGLKAFERLDKSVQQRIRHYLTDRVMPDPKRIGESLTGDKKGYWRYRVGDYRVIVKLLEDEVLVLVVHTAKRGEVYKVKL